MLIRLGLLFLVTACADSVAPDPIGRLCNHAGNCVGPARYMCVDRMCAFDTRPFDAGAPDAAVDASDAAPAGDAE